MEAPFDDNDPKVLDTVGICGPPCWGPLQWQALHHMLRGFKPTPAKTAALVAYVHALSDLLPCSVCGDHWRQLAKTLDPQRALQWSIDAHNAVNARLGKPVLSYGQAVRALQAHCSRRSSTTQTLWVVTTGVLFALLVAVLVVMAVLLGRKTPKYP
jgi:hypothetical protein